MESKPAYFHVRASDFNFLLCFFASFKHMGIHVFALDRFNDTNSMETLFAIFPVCSIFFFFLGQCNKFQAFYFLVIGSQNWTKPAETFLIWIAPNACCSIWIRQWILLYICQQLCWNKIQFHEPKMPG